MAIFAKKPQQPPPPKAVVDPIEAAAIKSQDAQPAPAPVVAQPPPPPAPAPVPVVAASPVPQPVPSAAKPRAMRVKVAKKVSLHGQITLLPVGTIVSEDSYGPGIFERLAEAKVELEPLP